MQRQQDILHNILDIDALQILYSRPNGKRLTLKAIKELASAIGRPPYNWTPERLWTAYETLEAQRVKGRRTPRAGWAERDGEPPAARRSRWFARTRRETTP